MSNNPLKFPGIKIGHADDKEALTGCTVVLCEAGAVAGVDQRGGAPGTRETDAIRPSHLVQKAHGILLAGGSAFGLNAAAGVMKYLEERGVGYDVRIAKVPIVPAAILFDLGIGKADVRPDEKMGYAACMNASSSVVVTGSVGAGMGATVGKVLGMQFAVKSGIGWGCIEVLPGLFVAALIAVNAFGDVIDPGNGKIIAGVRRGIEPLNLTNAPIFANTLDVIRASDHSTLSMKVGENTVIGVVITNAGLSPEQANFVAQMAHDGLARTIRPAHTVYDGDTLFVLATGEKMVGANVIGMFAGEAVSMAVLDAVWSSEPAGGLPSANSCRV